MFKNHGKKINSEQLSFSELCCLEEKEKNDSLVILSLCLEVMLKASLLSLSDKFWRLVKAGDVIPLASSAVTGNNVNLCLRNSV